MTLYVVATPIGNLGDMTFRAVDTLKRVSLILAEDTRHSSVLLRHYDISTPMLSYHKFNERQRTQELVMRMTQSDGDVALITDAGTPCISDPGYILIEAARAVGVDVVPIPGCCAAVTALCVCGFDTRRFCFIGFLPRERGDRDAVLHSMSQSDDDVFVLYESPNRITDTLTAIGAVMPCDALVANDLTKLHERHYYGDVRDVLAQLGDNANARKGEYTIVLRRKQKAASTDTAWSPEAILVNIMSQHDCTLRDAVTLAAEQYDVPRNVLYDASLRLRRMF